MPHQLPLPDAGSHVTLADARRNMLSKSKKGVSCPCCGRLVKLYRRKLHSEMAVFLIRLVKRFENEQRYYSTRELCPAVTKSSTDGSYLVYWDLIEREPMPGENESGGKIGMYRPTKAGREFAHGRSTAESHILMICGECVGFSEKFISIEDALGKKFDYKELMKGKSNGNSE